ncbi:MAG: squalene/phytoene synthase family protein [Alphaproteobacteria bacterium]|nr:squalene/phytoene synthase family protein [Alphaproteobacteria bacterium]
MATIPGYVKEVQRKTPVRHRRSAEADRLSPVAALVRHHDRDRFQTALFAPAARREALFALYAFNYEIARVRESVTQPMLGQIRLQWWRESVAAAFDGGPVRAHPVVGPLTAAVRTLPLTREHFDRLIDARERDLDEDPPASLAVLEDYAEASSARLVYLALEVLGAQDAGASEAGRHVGIAYSLAGLLRAAAFQARTGRRFIPADIAARTGLVEEDYRALRGTPALRAATAELAAAASKHLSLARAHPRGLRRRTLPALLPAVVARHSLMRLRRVAYDPFDPALAVPDPLQTWRLGVAALFNRF